MFSMQLKDLVILRMEEGSRNNAYFNYFGCWKDLVRYIAGTINACFIVRPHAIIAFSVFICECDNFIPFTIYHTCRYVL